MSTKIETCNYSRDFLLALQSCYLPPTIDKPTRVHKNSASLVDNIFVNNPEQVLISGRNYTNQYGQKTLFMWCFY